MPQGGLRCAAQRQLGERQGLPVECGTAQINEPLPAREMHIVFAIRDDSRHNRGRSHGVGLLEGLVTDKDKGLR